jgi:hypothetical protein
MLPEFVDLAPDQSELVVSFYFGNQRVILQIELQSLFEVVFFACFCRMPQPHMSIGYCTGGR